MQSGGVGIIQALFSASQAQCEDLENQEWRLWSAWGRGRAKRTLPETVLRGRLDRERQR